MDTLQKHAPILSRKTKAGMVAINLSAAPDSQPKWQRGTAERVSPSLDTYRTPEHLEQLNNKQLRYVIKRCLYRIEALERMLPNAPHELPATKTL